MEEFAYDPVLFLRGRSLPPNIYNPWLLILHQPIASFDIFRRLWDSTTYHVCADGGANRLHDLLEPLSRAHEFLPDKIIGDLDSLRPDVEQFYRKKGIAIERDRDQYSTDFGKAMKHIQREHHRVADGTHRSGDAGAHTTNVVVLGSISGRVDQGLGLLHELIREAHSKPSFRLWLISESNISFVMLRGKSRVATPLSEMILARNVGIVPIYGPAIITTSGFEWEVDKWKTSMGTTVSTSNHIVADSVTVETDHEVLFTIEYNADLPPLDNASGGD